MKQKLFKLLFHFFFNLKNKQLLPKNGQNLGFDKFFEQCKEMHVFWPYLLNFS